MLPLAGHSVDLGNIAPAKVHNAPDLVLLKKKNRKTTIKYNYSWRRDRQLIISWL